MALSTWATTLIEENIEMSSPLFAMDDVDGGVLPFAPDESWTLEKKPERTSLGQGCSPR